MQLILTSCFPEESFRMGKMLGQKIENPLTILFYGDLGSGKTVFVQGVARGLSVPEDYYITSPTYTLVNEYPARFPFFHVDLYRIGDPGEIYETGFFELLSGENVVAVEWAERLAEPLPGSAIHIRMEALDENTRKIQFLAKGGEAEKILQDFQNDPGKLRSG
jgi:tRNA threonylcarbamoyladenosine biosynthesis protein TsaE